MSEQQILEIDNELNLDEQIGEVVDGIESEDLSDISSYPFDPKEIFIDTKPYTLDLIIKRIKRSQSNTKSVDGISLSPEFQRNILWDKKKQSRLIESIFLRIPLPVFYIAEDKEVDNHWIIVDGLQRMHTLQEFVVKKNLRLIGLEYNKSLNGLDWDDIPDYLKTRLEETQVLIHTIKRNTPETVMFNVFQRINTGGIVLSSQEIRHALNQGKITIFLKELAEKDEFLEATNYGVKSTRMADRECVLRFIAFSLNPYEDFTDSITFDMFLSNVMRKMNKENENLYDYLRENFILAMKRSVEIFGKEGFRKIGNDTRRYPVNKALFEVWAVLLAQLNEHEAKKLIEHKSSVLDKFELLLSDRDFVNSVSAGTGNANNVKSRFSKIKNLIDEVLNV